MNLQHVATNEKTIDVLTKPLSKVTFEYFREKLGVIQKDIPHKRE